MPKFFRWVGALIYAAAAAVLFFLLATVGLMIGGAVLLVMGVAFFFMRRRLAGRSRFMVFTGNGQTFTTSSTTSAPRGFGRQRHNTPPCRKQDGCYDLQPEDYTPLEQKPKELK